MAATNMPTTLSARARKALDLLANGARFVVRLERDGYTGREQFRHRIVSNGLSVKGYGVAVFYELHRGGWLTIAEKGTSVSSYYKLNPAR